tara:strand:- start:8948 stop:9715 length:768 start_codon:yes stop_codon:yes gene_type:complete
LLEWFQQLISRQQQDEKHVSDKAKTTQKASTVKAPRALTEDEVRQYLVAHPAFFDHNKDLLALLKPERTPRADGIVDFQAVLLDRLQSEIAELSDVQGSLIHASRSNMTTQARIHDAVLALLEAESLDHLCHMVSQDWVDMLQVDSISICFEQGRNLPENSNIRRLSAGMVDDLLGVDQDATLRGDISANGDIFGPATPLIKAEALIRLPESDLTPAGLLAFGSRDEAFFTPGQGTELLRFLQAAFQARLIHFLD